MAKNVFRVHGITSDGMVAFNRSLRRAEMFTCFQKLEPCLIGMEACGFSHSWARELSKLGHVVKLIAPVYVKPDVKRGKSDAADAVRFAKRAHEGHLPDLPQAACDVVTDLGEQLLTLHARVNW